MGRGGVGVRESVTRSLPRCRREGRERRGRGLQLCDRDKELQGSA